MISGHRAQGVEPHWVMFKRERSRRDVSAQERGFDLRVRGEGRLGLPRLARTDLGVQDGNPGDGDHQ